MILRNCEGIEWLEFELLADEKDVVHGIFLKRGGLSAAPFGSLNFSVAVGEEPSIVAQNREKVRGILGIERLVPANMVHGNQIFVVDREKAPASEECDGLVTSERGIGLLTTHADCQACLLYDPIRKVAANVHSGWRGNVLNIYREAIATMRQRFGSRPADILACISPSLGPCHAEFVNYQRELPVDFLKYQVTPGYFDLWAVAEEQLTGEGVLVGHIEIAEICTYCRSGNFYSYRRDKICGRHGALIALR